MPCPIRVKLGKMRVLSYTLESPQTNERITPTMTVSRTARAMQEMLWRRADQLGWETGFMERERKLTGSSFVTGLVSGWQNDPDSSVAGLAQAVGNAGTPITRQGLDQRFDAKAVALMRKMLEASLEVVLGHTAVPDTILSRFSAVYLTDSSVVTLPNRLSEVFAGSGGYGEQASTSAAKISVRWNITHGALEALDITDATVHDRASVAHHGAAEVGSLQIKDLGYFKLDDFRALGEEGSYWLTRYKVGTTVYDEHGERLSLSAWLPQTAGKRLEAQVQVGARQRLPSRLVAERVPAHVVEQRHERIHETARRNQRPASQLTLEMAKWTLYLTNAPQSLLAAAELFILARYRWQIELLFKLWKTDLGIDRWCTQNPHRILCELYGKLLVAVVTHWLLLLGCWHNPRRSLRQAIPTIRGLAWQWANSLDRLDLLEHALRSLVRALSTCHMDRSRTHPRHFELLEPFAA